MSESSNWKTASLEQWFDIGITLISEQNIQCKNWLIRVYQSFIFVGGGSPSGWIFRYVYTWAGDRREKKVYIFDTFCLGITSTLYSILYNF